MKCYKKIKIEDTIYTANTDFRIAIRCNQIAQDETIGDFERVLGIIFTVFGDDGLNNTNHYEKLLNWVQKWLSFGKEIVENNEEPDMDFIEDYDYIVASFQSDYGMNLDEEEMDWHRFNNLLNGLSNSEMGNCCVLNRIRNLRNFDTKKIKDSKEKERIEKAKKQFALKKNKNHKQKDFTDEEIKNMEEFDKLFNS